MLSFFADLVTQTDEDRRAFENHPVLLDAVANGTLATAAARAANAAAAIPAPIIAADAAAPMDALPPCTGAATTLAPLAGRSIQSSPSRISEPTLVRQNRLTGLVTLLVEDDDDSREIVAMLLSSYGAEVIEARSAAEAMRQLTRSVPDVLVDGNADTGKLRHGMNLMLLFAEPPPDSP